MYAETFWDDYTPKGIKIAFFSDLHLDASDQTMQITDEIKNFLEDIRPDLIILSGDYVKWGGDYAPALSFLDSLKAPMGVWAVLGDYDYSDSRKSCLFCHHAGNGALLKHEYLTILRDTTHIIPYENHGIEIGGIDGSEEFHTLSEKSDHRDVPFLVLSHSPLVFDKLKQNGKMIVFSGDTHGGQIFLPKWLWSLTGYEKNAKYNYGLYQKGEKRMIVTSGIGTSHVTFRLFCRPEIVVVHL